jgi:site-specific DNA recombinase
MKAIIFARVSTKDQEETGYSLESQKALLAKYAQEKQYEVVKTFSVSESASGRKVRKEFDEMLRFANTNAIDVIVCEKTDRLTRNPKDAVAIDEWVQAENSRAVHMVKEGTILNQQYKAHEGLVWNMKVAIAKFYTDNLSEEVKKGMAEKVKIGVYPGPAKMGYKTTILDGKKVHMPDDKTAPFIKWMFDEYSGGITSLSKLTIDLYNMGFRSLTGRKIAKSNIARYLSDPFYYGSFEWNNQLHPGTHEPLITKSVYDEVQRIKLGGTTPKYRKHNHLFKGLLNCGCCGGTVTWEIHKGINYGHCNGYRACTSHEWVKENEVEQEIASLFNGMIIQNNRFATWLLKALKESSRSETDFRATEVAAATKQIILIEQKLGRLYEDRLEGRIDVKLYDAKSQELRSEKESLVNLTNAHSNVSNKSKDLGIALFELSQNATQVYFEKSIEDKRKLLTTVFERIELKDGQIVPELTEPFKILTKAISVTNSSKVVEQLTNPVQIFEPLEKGSTKSNLISLKDLCPQVLGYKDSNLDTQDQNLMSYH